MAEVTAVAKYVSYWFPEIPNWVTALFCVLFLMFLNLLSAKLFGELEFWFAIIKVVTIIALIVIGIVMIVLRLKHRSDTRHSQIFTNTVSSQMVSTVL